MALHEEEPQAIHGDPAPAALQEEDSGSGRRALQVRSLRSLPAEGAPCYKLLA